MMNKEIQKGDRIFARLSMGRRVILEFMINRVGSMAELLAELRQMTGSLRGLGRLQVRNQSRGWAQVHNLMFYGEGNSCESGVFGAINSAEQHVATPSKVAATSHVATPSRESHAMLFPWETH